MPTSDIIIVLMDWNKFIVDLRYSDGILHGLGGGGTRIIVVYQPHMDI